MENSHVAADPEKREEIELEWRSREFLVEMINQKRELEEKQKNNRGKEQDA